MNGYRAFAHAAIAMLGEIAVLSVLAGPVLGQSQAESLSASFRKAVARVSPAVVAIRPAGVALPFVQVPLPNFGPFRTGELGPRAAARIGEIDAEAGGSGLVIDADRGHILTNDHVLRGASQAVVILPGGRERFSSEIRRDPRFDVAILSIDPKGLDLTQVVWGDPGTLEAGDWVLSAGQPAVAAPAYSAGIFSAFRPRIGSGPADGWLETDAVVNSTNSGGPLVNLKGEVLGINSALASRRGGLAGMSYAMPANRARRIAADLAEFGHVRRAYLGVQVEPVQQVSAPDRPREAANVVIVAVTPGTPAADAGLRPGDRILSIAGRPIAGPGMLQSVVELAPIGEELTVSVERGGQRVDVKVRPQAQANPAEFGRGGPGSRIEPDPLRDSFRGRNRDPARNPAVPVAPRPEAPAQRQPPGLPDPLPQRNGLEPGPPGDASPGPAEDPPG
jgi:serine protease Do